MSELSSLRLDLISLESGDFPGGGAVLTHALALDLIRRGDSDVATAAHAGRSIITTSGLIAGAFPALGRVRIAPGEQVAVRVTGAGPGIRQSLLSGIESSRGDVRIGRTRFFLASAECEELGCPNPATLEDLAESALDCQGHIRIRFVSPTTFKRGSTWLALPSPENVFGSYTESSPKGLAAKWADISGSDATRAFNGARLGARVLDLAPVSSRVRADNPFADAFVGAVEYAATSARDRRWMWTLGMLAQFTGVGWKTAMGMGQVRVEQVDAD